MATTMLAADNASYRLEKTIIKDDGTRLRVCWGHGAYLPESAFNQSSLT